MSKEPRARKVVVEAIIPAPVEVVWERSQVPEQHTAWDIRFNHIAYLDETDNRGYHLMDYRTNIALGVEIKGYGRYLTNSEYSHSSFEFDSDDWKSIIRNGRGIWLYRPCLDCYPVKVIRRSTHKLIEAADLIVGRVREALRYFTPEQIHLNPDCGWGTFAERPMNTAAIAARKLGAIAEAARQLRGTAR